MQFLKKLGIFVLSFLLVYCIGAIMLSYTIQEVIQKDLFTNVIKETAIPSLTNSMGLSEEDSKALEELMDDEELNKTINEISSGLIGALGDPNAEFDQTTFDQLMDYFIENKEELEKITGSEVDVSAIENFKNSEEYAQFSENITNTINESTASMNEPTRTAIKSYIYIISDQFRITLAIASVVIIILIALIQWSFYKWLSPFGKSLATSGVGILVFCLAVGYFVDYLSKEYQFHLQVNTSSLMTMSIISIIVGLLCVIACKIITNMINIKKNKEVVSSEIS